jgi:hypothetical protein
MASINQAFTSGNRAGHTSRPHFDEQPLQDREALAMLKRILVPLDGSELAERALVYAEMARRSPRRVSMPPRGSL